jgi:hypothetical protein
MSKYRLFEIRENMMNRRDCSSLILDSLNLKLFSIPLRIVRFESLRIAHFQ